MPETTYWRCDSCGGKIVRPEDGWIEWIEFSTESSLPVRGRNLRLVHDSPAVEGRLRKNCQFNEDAEFQQDKGIVCDSGLEDFLGPDGLMQLLSLISEGQVPQGAGIEMIKRLHIPGYEVARRYFRDATNQGVFDPNTAPDFHWQSDIARVLSWVESQKLEG